MAVAFATKRQRPPHKGRKHNRAYLARQSGQAAALAFRHAANLHQKKYINMNHISY